MDTNSRFPFVDVFFSLPISLVFTLVAIFITNFCTWTLCSWRFQSRLNGKKFLIGRRRKFSHYKKRFRRWNFFALSTLHIVTWHTWRQPTDRPTIRRNKAYSNWNCEQKKSACRKCYRFNVLRSRSSNFDQWPLRFRIECYTQNISNSNRSLFWPEIVK